MSDNIPYEIQMEIIKKVPDVKSLLRCRAVSKQWKSFIDRPEFIACYGVRHSQPHRLLLSYRHIEDVKYVSKSWKSLSYRHSVDPSEVNYVSFLDDVSFPKQQLDFAANVSDLVKQLNNPKVIDSSCGLWCLRGYNTSEKTDMVVLWNPSIRKSVGIVLPHLLHRFAFGVCPSTYDPTIVAMSFQKMWQVGIFTLSSKTWKMIPSTNLPRGSIRLGSYTNVAIDRFIFWVAYDRIVGNDGAFKYKSLILSFDFITHDFKEVHLPVSMANPVSIANRDLRYISISKLNESLVVSAYDLEVNDELVYGVWMMGEEGSVMISFTKLFNINTPDSSIRRLLGFRKSGEPIMETVKKDEQVAALKVYEPFSKHINNLGIYGKRAEFFIRHYTEALLLIDHSDGCIISNDY